MFPVSVPNCRISFVEDLLEIAAVRIACPDASLWRIPEGNRFAVRRKSSVVSSIGIANGLPFAALRINEENAVWPLLFRFLAVHDPKFRTQKDAPNLLSCWSLVRVLRLLGGFFPLFGKGPYSSTGS